MQHFSQIAGGFALFPTVSSITAPPPLTLNLLHLLIGVVVECTGLDGVESTSQFSMLAHYLLVVQLSIARRHVVQGEDGTNLEGWTDGEEMHGGRDRVQLTNELPLL